MSNLRWLRASTLALAIAAGGLTACSSSDEKASEPITATAQQQMVTVTPEAVDEFVAAVRAQNLVPAAMPDEQIRPVVTNVCRLAGTGTSYGDQSAVAADQL
ncbi:MAG: hypothetical protein EOP32_22350, partial [Rhodococcus sp. (in: high G+C Gram-positive bacteria)]